MYNRKQQQVVRNLYEDCKRWARTSYDKAHEDVDERMQAYRLGQADAHRKDAEQIRALDEVMRVL